MPWVQDEGGGGGGAVRNGGTAMEGHMILEN